MNPFEDEIGQTNVLTQLETNEIVVWKENRGRKTNTYVSGWNTDKDQLKEYLKEFKKKNGCNGSLKTVEEKQVLHFQGDKVIDIIEFMVSKGIDSESIITKGM